MFRLESQTLTGNASQEHRYYGLSLKVMLNLRVVGVFPTPQNVLFVARYPVTIATVKSFAALPLAACGVLPQASQAVVQAVCSGTKYINAVALPRPSLLQTALPAGPERPTGSLQVYPNPATGAVRLRYQLPQAGPVRLTVQDNLGRTVRTVLNQEQPAGSHETTLSLSGLRAGIYYCFLQTATHQRVERLVITE